MTRRPLVNVAQSVHQRLLAQAQETGRPFNELLQHYAIERFLYRLGRSQHAAKLLLKGALLLRVWQIPLARPTMDIDVLDRADGTAETLVSILRKCMLLKITDDGMQYDPESITTEAITADADYPGWRIRFKASLGKARVAMQVDVGVGDSVYPAPIWIDYPVLLDQAAPHLLAYAPETAIAEKYQAMVELDMANSRMKDFHDIWTLTRHLDFDGTKLTEAIRRTFERRKTLLPKSDPTALTPEFYEDRAKQTQWRAFLRKGQLENEELTLGRVAKDLHDFLMPPTESLVRDEDFTFLWHGGSPWKRTTSRKSRNSK
ncbi:MAG: nucleotidyl transferase AbiEii/AbiGii toxin family protein [Acidobacteriia bacterium]|nr:nucleotidyl transferase AbiEii/AbiGii toxin family protein [Terriglobia bacterium]